MASSESAAGTGGAEVRVVPTGATLLVKSGFYAGLEVTVDRDWVVIGRGRSADVVIAEPTISRAHAAIGFDERGFFVQDLGSTNGTLVNGGRAVRQVLKSGDEVQMGRLVVGVTLPT
ncbi:MAG: FHA domain-containing protein [Proteobacteria bacterium]|nr:FHA domain-containing protein [Pseudomonadota bacterium]MCZ6785411.1 FHA domain-containing protein [Pseudomonadota bacterium]